MIRYLRYRSTAKIWRMRSTHSPWWRKSSRWEKINTGFAGQWWNELNEVKNIEKKLESRRPSVTLPCRLKQKHFSLYIVWGRREKNGLDLHIWDGPVIEARGKWNGPLDFISENEPAHSYWWALQTRNTSITNSGLLVSIFHKLLYYK